MDEKIDPKEHKRLKKAVQASHAAAIALTKDAATLSRQAAILKARAAEARAASQETRAASQETRAVASRDSPPAADLLTIPEAARRLQVAERALRLILAAPDLHERLVERTRKVGIYYKFIPLLPTDLLADLPARLPDRKPPGHGTK